MEKWRRVARKLEAVIANPGTPEEGAAAAQKLKLIIKTHLLSYDNIHVEEAVTEEPGDAWVVTGHLFQRERGNMVVQVAQTLGGCGIVINHIRKVHVFGFGRELDRIVTTSDLLLAQLAFALAKAGVPWYFRLRPWGARQYRRSFVVGWSAMVIHILESYVKPTGTRWSWATQRGQEVAVRSRRQILEARMAKLHPGSTTFTVDDKGPGYEAGRSAGATADVLATRVTATATPREITSG